MHDIRRYLGLPLRDGSRMTFLLLPDLISSRLLAVVRSTHVTMCMIPVKVLQGLVVANSHVFCKFKDSEESPKITFLY